MAGKPLSDAADSGLLCCVTCGKLLSDPVVLSCLHNCCRKCVDGLSVRDDGKEASLTCPRCGQVTEVTSPKVNLFIAARLAEASAQRFTCDICRTEHQMVTAAHFSCAECSQMLCNVCLTWHSKFMKRHVITALADGSGSPATVETLLPACAVHRRECSMYCFACGCLKCVSCSESCAQARHEVFFLDTGRVVDHVRQVKQAVQRAINAVESQLSLEMGLAPNGDRDTALRGDLQNLELNKQEALGAIERAHRSAVIALTKWYTGLASRESGFREALQPLNKKLSDIKLYAQLLMTSGRDVDILDQHGLLNTTLNLLSVGAEELRSAALCGCRFPVVSRRPSDVLEPEALKLIGFHNESEDCLLEQLSPKLQGDPGYDEQVDILKQPKEQDFPVVYQSQLDRDPLLQLGAPNGLTEASSTKITEQTAMVNVAEAINSGQPERPTGDLLQQPCAEDQLQRPTSDLLQQPCAEDQLEHSDSGAKSQAAARVEKSSLLSCCVCNQLVVEPVLLACLHNCCRRCADKVAAGAGSRNARITCPKCNCVTSATDARSNSFVEAQVHAVRVSSGSPMCSICEGDGEQRPAEYACNNCYKLLCCGCHRRHGKFKKSCQNVVPVTAGTALPVFLSLSCTVHSRQHEIFCFACCALKCMECSKACLEAKHEMAAADGQRASEYAEQVMADMRATLSVLGSKAPRCTETPDSGVACGAHAAHLWEDAWRETASEVCDEAEAAVTAVYEGFKEGLLDLELLTDIDVPRPAGSLEKRLGQADRYCRLLLESDIKTGLLDQYKFLTTCLNSLRDEIGCHVGGAEPLSAAAAAAMDAGEFSVIDSQQDDQMVADLLKQTGALSRDTEPLVRSISEHPDGLRSRPQPFAADDRRSRREPPAEDQILLLHCCNCQQPLLQPMLLSCLHNCCRQCVTNAGNGSEQEAHVVCLMCKQTSSTVHGIKPNLYLEGHIRSLRTAADVSPQCASCADDYDMCHAELFCFDCDKYLCGKCQSWHDKFTPNHDVVPAAEARRCSLLPKCSGHRGRSKFFCVTCEVFRCIACGSSCMNGKHKMVIVDSDQPDCPLLAEIVGGVQTLLREVWDRASKAARLRRSISAALLADVRKLRANRDSLLDVIFRGKASDAPARHSGDRTVGGLTLVSLLNERMHHAICYCSAVLASGSAASVLDQHGAIMSCLKTLGADLDATSTGVTPELSTGVVPEASSNYDIRAALRRWIGFPRTNADQALASREQPSSSTQSSADVASKGTSSSETLSMKADGTVKEQLCSSTDQQPARNISKDGASSTNFIFNDIAMDGSGYADVHTKAHADARVDVHSAENLRLAKVGHGFALDNSCRDVAAAADDRVLFAVLWKGLKEYDVASHKKIGRWRPPPWEGGKDCVSTLDVLADGTVVVGLIASQAVALLRRTSSGTWEEQQDRRLILRAGPWRLSCCHGRVATVGAHDVSAPGQRHWSPGPYLDVMQISDGEQLLSTELSYDIQAVALAPDFVVVLSNEFQQTAEGRRAYVADAYGFQGELLWRVDSGNACDVCIDPGSGIVYLALLHSDRVRAIRCADGGFLKDALNSIDHRLSAPFRISLTPKYSTLAVLSSRNDKVRVNLYAVSSS